MARRKLVVTTVTVRGSTYRLMSTNTIAPLSVLRWRVRNQAAAAASNAIGMALISTRDMTVEANVRKRSASTELWEQKRTTASEIPPLARVTPTAAIAVARPSTP